jgi:NitT/TauT family transport system substrate-binding protein
MKKSMFLSILILIFSITFGCWMGGLTKAEAAEIKPEKTKIKLGISLNDFAFLPVYLAVDQGLFKKEGLDVELLVFSGGSELIKGTVSGSIDIGYSGLSSLSLGIDAGQKMKVFYAGNNLSGFSLYSVPKIKSMADVKGARIGITRYGSTTDFITRYALKSKGLDPAKDVQIVQGGATAARMAAMDKGQLDICILASPDDFIAEEKGFNLILRQRDFMKEFPLQDFYAMEKFIKENPNTIKAFLRGYVQAVRLAKKDRELSVKAIAEHVGLEKKYANRSYDEIINYIYEDGRWPDEKSMDIFWEMGMMIGAYKEKWPREKYFDSTFVDTYSQWKP